MKSSLYGYVRVSTKEQNEARQVIAMHEFGVDERNVFIEKQSGKDFNRPQYKKLLRKLKAGDTLVIKSTRMPRATCTSASRRIPP